jgi:RNA-directed DNA polymerase
LFFKIIAIDQLSKSNGARTPGVDKIKLTSNKKDKDLYLKLLEYINNQIKDPNNYKASPVKRVWVAKTSGKLRPLGIPTIEDRALQYLLNLILEPLVEMTGEPHSFGFRPYRSAKYAIAYLRSLLKTRDKKSIKKRASKSNAENQLFELLPEDKVILDADIRGFFDNINHEWILNNLFLHPNLMLFIKAWLNSEALDKNIFFETEIGTPQGGIISPTLANFTLNGLEKTVMDSINPLTKSKEKRIAIRLMDGSKTRIASALAYVRYADDFIVLARSNHIMNNYVLPSINNFLKPRGLTLNNEKTKTFRLSDKNMQLDFLGYTFKYNNKWSIKRHIFYSQHAGSRGIALYPNKEKVNKFINKIKHIFKKSNNLDAYNLIAKLNPILRGWSNYYNLANSSHYRSTIRNALYRLVWKWASRKHRRWSRKSIAETYFLTKDLTNDKSTSSKAESYKKFKNTKWVFHGSVKNKSRYNINNNKTVYLVDVTNITQLLSSKHYILPKKLLNIHGYHSDYMCLLTFSTNLKFKSAGVDSSFKQRLLAKQNNLCVHCEEPLITSDSLYNDAIHIHHIKPIYKGGSRNSITNMVIVHSWCHYDIDHKNESA